MSTILWIILIDCSGSMSEHFSGLGEFDGFSEVGDYEIKIDAAKDVLIKQIKGLSFNCDVAVIKFSDDAELVSKFPKSLFTF